VVSILSNVKRQLLQLQKRSYMIGIVQKYEPDFVLFDHEDEQILFQNVLEKDLDIYINGRWEKGKWVGGSFVQIGSVTYELQDGEKIRVKKNLAYSFQQVLEELSDESFTMFVKHLNHLSFSIYDLLYGHNQLLFQKKGASIYVFDNGEQICAVQHFFERSGLISDRFEFTLSTGERSIITSLTM
jgi:hypothetical protein